MRREDETPGRPAGAEGEKGRDVRGSAGDMQGADRGAPQGAGEGQSRVRRETGWEYEWAVHYALTCTDRGRHKVTELAQFDADLGMVAEVSRPEPNTGKVGAIRKDTAVRQWGPGRVQRSAGPLITADGVPVRPPEPRHGTKRDGYEFRCPRCNRTMRYTADRLQLLVDKMTAAGMQELDLSALG